MGGGSSRPKKGAMETDLLAGVDDVDAEGVDGVAADVVAVHARDEHLALVVVDKEAADHGAGHQLDRGALKLPPKFQGCLRSCMCQLPCLSLHCLCLDKLVDRPKAEKLLAIYNKH